MVQHIKEKANGEKVVTLKNTLNAPIYLNGEVYQANDTFNIILLKGETEYMGMTIVE